MPALGLKSLRGLLALILLFSFAGTLPLTFGQRAEAKAKKIVRKAKSKKIVKKPKRKVSRKTVKRAKKIVRSKKKKTVGAKPAAKAANKAFNNDNGQYQLPSRSGSLTQRYAIEEGLGGDEVDNMISGLQAIGADDVSVDSSKNMATVTYNTSKLTSVGIVKKLKTLGFSARRIF